MKKKTPLPVYIVSIILLIYTVLISVNGPASVTTLLFGISPFLIIWMVIAVLRSKDPSAKELGKEEEWGYADKQKEELGTF